MKRRIVAEIDAEGVTVCEAARRYDIEPSQLFHWRKQFRDEAATPTNFLPVEVSAGIAKEENKSANQGARHDRTEGVFPNGRHLKASPTLDRDLLDSLIGAVSGAV